MVYIIILNWNGAQDTIECLKTVFSLKQVQFQIVVCDNASPDGSYTVIRNWLSTQTATYPYLASCSLVELKASDARKYTTGKQSCIYLIQNGANHGYAAGNNVGIRLALNDESTKYVWLLNNDTEVESESLFHLVDRCNNRPDIGICGSRLVLSEDRTLLQGLGGIYNPWFCTTKHFAEREDSQEYFDDDLIESKIDYVIGASMLIRRSLLDEIGLLEESYFLYYEELDIAFRSRKRYKIGLASKSIVYHKVGRSTESGKSEIADVCSVKNRIRFTRIHNKKFLPIVWLSLFFVLFNRIKRKEFRKAKIVARIISGLDRS